MLKQTLLLLTVILPLRPAVHAATPVAKPNFVVIFMDDMGYADIGPFGATKQKTPQLDRMAREGMKLTSFYAAPVCSVSRAQLLTGCYGARISVPGVYFPGQNAGLNPAESTVAERLKEQGYATACIGKWHLGDQLEFLPTRQGFDSYFGIPYSNDMQKKSVKTGGQVVPLLRDDKVAELLTDEAQRKIVERYTDEALAFIRAKKDAPFFLYLPHNAIHTPIFPGEKFAGKSSNGRVGDWIEEVDWSTGRILETLRELKLESNTLVLFTSDNGPWATKGADAGSAGPLRGAKGSTWEGGVRVPTVAWWPGKIAPASTCDAVAGTIDLLPTLVNLAGGKVPAEPVIDGRDIAPLLLGKSKEPSREAHYYFTGYNLHAVRQGAWKLAIAAQADGMGQGTPKDAASAEPRLYNLDTDIGERDNVAAKNPEIVTRLKALAEKTNAEIGGSKPAARRPAGSVAEPKPLYEIENKTPKPAAPPTSVPTSLESLKPGATVSSDAAPQVAGKAFSLVCTAETAQRDAVIVAHGGAALGYALHIKNGALVFAIRTNADAVTEISVPNAGPKPWRISAQLAADGTMTLRINDQTTAGKAPGPLPRQPFEDFCLGHDNKVPVTTYGSQERFNGTITGLKVTVQ